MSRFDAQFAAGATPGLIAQFGQRIVVRSGGVAWNIDALIQLEDAQPEDGPEGLRFVQTGRVSWLAAGGPAAKAADTLTIGADSYDVVVALPTECGLAGALVRRIIVSERTVGRYRGR